MIERAVRPTARFACLGAVAVASAVSSTPAVAQRAASTTDAPPGVVTAISCNATATPATATPPVVPRLTWRGDDVRWAEWPVRLGERAVPVRIIVVTFDPRQLHVALDLVQQDGELRPWNLDAAPAEARIALNAGQFTDTGPWGWVVHRGREWQAPGSGALAGALVVDTAGALDIISAGDVAAWRGASRLREAVQSYPTLLEGAGAPPSALCAPDGGVDRTHRDTRLAIGVLRDGRAIIALSRYAGGTLPDRIPIGPTTPEMAEVMRRLGAVRALMLDGGLSAQVLVRERAGSPPRQWKGLRDVPLALVIRR